MEKDIRFHTVDHEIESLFAYLLMCQTDLIECRGIHELKEFTVVIQVLHRLLLELRHFKFVTCMHGFLYHFS